MIKNKILIILSVFLLIATNILVGYDFTNQYVFLLWIGSIILLITSFQIANENFLSKFIKIFKDFYSFNFIFPLAIFCSIRLFCIYHASILRSHHDEYTFTLSSYEFLQNFLKTHSLNMLGSQYGPVSNWPSLWFCIQAFFLYLFGLNLYAPKIYPFLTDLGIFSILWYYGKNYLKSERTAFFISLFYASFLPPIFFSLTTYNNLQSSFFYCLVFLLLILMENKINNEKNEKYYIYIGLITGFSYYFYLSSIVLPLYTITFLFYLFLKDKKLKTCFKKFAFFFLGYIYACLPFWVYNFFRYNFIGGRKSVIWTDGQSIYQRILELYDRAISILYIFCNENWNNDFFLEFHFFDKKIFFYLFILGLIISFYNIKKNQYFIILNFLFLTFLTGGILTTGSVPVQRMLPIVWLSTIFVGIGLNFIFEIMLTILGKIKFLNKKFALNSILTLCVIYILFLQIETIKKAFVNSVSLREEIIELLDYQKGKFLPVTGLLPEHIHRIFRIYTQNYNYPIFNMNDRKRFNQLLRNKTPHYFLIYNLFRKNDYKFGKYRKHYRKVNTKDIFSAVFTYNYSLYKFVK